MAAQVLEISDRETLVFGLSWRVLDSMEPRGLQVNKLREQGAKFFVSYKSEIGEENFGTTDGLEVAAGQKKVRFISGAAQIARHAACIEREAVLITIEEPGSANHSAVVAVVGVLHGNVVLDEVVSPDQVQAKREWFLGEASKRQIRSSQVGGLAFTIPDVDFSMVWIDVLATRMPSLPLLPKSQYQLAVLAPQISPKVIQVGAALCGVVAVGFAGWQGFDLWKSAEAKKRAAMARKAPDPLIIYQQSVQALLSTAIWPAKTSLPKILEEINAQVPSFRRGGWALDAVKCEAASSLCVYSWHREKGTMATFRDSLGTQKWDSIQYGMTSITATKKVAMSGVILPARQAWLDSDHYYITERSLWTRWQDIGVKFTYGDPAIAALPSGILEGQIASSPVLMRSLAWKIEGPLWSRSVMDALPESTTLQTLDLIFKSALGAPPSMEILATGQIFLR